ncbi:hypothetical protein HDU76_010351 [Blyttiomyces sp. JEL0837]|nr:hypothetical protein HDU76_010351 [Blyttiomyces sp. JEL0837]
MAHSHPDPNFWDIVPDQVQLDSTKMTIDAATVITLVQELDTLKSRVDKQEGEVQYWKHKAEIQEVEVQRLKEKGKIQEELVQRLKEKGEIQEEEVHRLQERVGVLEGRVGELEVELSLKTVGEIVAGSGGEIGSGSGDSTVRGSTSLAPEGSGFDGVLGSEKVLRISINKSCRRRLVKTMRRAMVLNKTST